jgi:hypothetical protein
MKAAIFALFAFVGFSSPCIATQNSLPAGGLLVAVDWQEPALLPPQFRNHCAIDRLSGRPYCANHCGTSYQFYYCSQASFGCCHLGRGYCDWNGHLRCAP